jgi:hypothetical protein
MNPVPTEPPVARGLFLCDLVILEAQSGKVSLINTFDRFRDAAGAILKPFVVYAHLSDCAGDVVLRVAIESLADLRPVYAYESLVRFTDRFTPLHFRLNVIGCKLPAHGAYQCVLYANGEPLTRTRIEFIA